MLKTRVLFRIALVAIVALFVSDFARADAPKVTAVLGNSEVAVGQTVRLQVRVTGARSAETPASIDVDGLEIHRTGTEQYFEMNNLNMSASVIYNYTVYPQKPGNFKIPPQTIRVAGTSLKTPELTLHVVGTPGPPGAGRQAGPNQGTTANIDPNKLVFAELIVPKKTAYVGEMIPVVIRVGFFTRGQLADAPEITGQGFTMQKFQMPQQPQVESINGRRCEVLTFKTAIAAARSGKFEIGPVQANAIVRVPQERRQRAPRSPFDIFNMDDPFADPFFADPFSAFGRQEKLTIKSDPVGLEVKPLPPNPPASFSGAIGNFSMTVDANPKSVQAGDPITVEATISGRGNFDRVTVPTLEDEYGWHKYPPSSKFKQDDDVGISGTKTFETVLSSNEKKPAISPFLFSFFDPQKEKYITLKNEAIPVRIEGGVVAAATVPPQPATATPAPAAPAAGAAKAPPKPQDILYQLTDRPAYVESFTPLHARPVFWLTQTIPLLGLLGFVGWKIRRVRLDNREAQRVALLNHEAANLMRKLRRGDGSPQEYYLNASRAIQVKTALAKNVDPSAVDVEMAGSVFDLDENSRRQLRQLFARSDEVRYSGAHNGGEILSPESRREVLNLIEHLRI